MSVIVDTPVWSFALRRRQPSLEIIEVLSPLWAKGEAILLGIVRQELLSGVHDRTAFAKLRDQLRAQPDHPVTMYHYELAAEYFSTCRARGIQGSVVDYLICAVGVLDELPIFTTDEDFAHYAQHLPIQLWESRG